MDDEALERYADQSSFEDALVLYAKEGKSAGYPPPAWNLWQVHANMIAQFFSGETREFRGKTEYFARMREVVMAEVYGSDYKKKMVSARPVSRSRSYRPAAQAAPDRAAGVSGTRSESRAASPTRVLPDSRSADSAAPAGRDLSRHGPRTTAQSTTAERSSTLVRCH